MVKPDKLVMGTQYMLSSNKKPIGTYDGTGPMDTAPGRTQDAPSPSGPPTVTLYFFKSPDGYRRGHIEKGLDNIVPATAPQGGRRRRTHRMLFKKWAAQEAREMSHKGKRMTFRKWAANELKEKAHPGNPSFKKWAKQEMREKSHTRRRR